MKNRKDKRRDMCRSILPSTARKSARDDKRNEAQRYRSNIKRILNSYDFNVDEEYDALHADIADNDGWHKRNTKERVYDRRGADKVGPIMKWAEEITRDIPEADRYSYMAAMLPKNLIGRHAMSHIEQLDGFETNPYMYRRYYTSPEKLKMIQFTRACDWAAIFGDLYNICNNGNLLARLNRVMKSERSEFSHYEYQQVWERRNYKDPTLVLRNRRVPQYRMVKGRPLYGVHDIEDFMADMAKTPELLRRLASVLNEFAYERKEREG